MIRDVALVDLPEHEALAIILASPSDYLDDPAAFTEDEVLQLLRAMRRYRKTAEGNA